MPEAPYAEAMRAASRNVETLEHLVQQLRANLTHLRGVIEADERRVQDAPDQVQQDAARNALIDNLRLANRLHAGLENQLVGLAEAERLLREFQERAVQADATGGPGKTGRRRGLKPTIVDVERVAKELEAQDIRPTLNEIGPRLGVSGSRVYQIRKEARAGKARG